MNSIIISFLKSKNISYYYKDGIITFPCFICKRNIIVNGFDDIWNCENCKEKGNLMTLQKLWEREKSELVNIEVFNPYKEIWEIRNLMKRLGCNDTSRMLKQKVEKLIKYCDMD